MSLKSNTMNDGDADPSKKIKEIAHKRKLLDIAKQQTEEIEVLRDELDRLRARTFPSFAHLHNKPGYPDENWIRIWHWRKILAFYIDNLFLIAEVISISVIHLSNSMNSWTNENLKFVINTIYRTNIHFKENSLIFL